VCVCVISYAIELVLTCLYRNPENSHVLIVRVGRSEYVHRVSSNSDLIVQCG